MNNLHPYFDTIGICSILKTPKLFQCITWPNSDNEKHMGDFRRVLFMYFYTINFNRTRKRGHVWNQMGQHEDKLSAKFASFNEAVNCELYSVGERNYCASRGACVHK